MFRTLALRLSESSICSLIIIIIVLEVTLKDYCTKPTIFVYFKPKTKNVFQFQEQRAQLLSNSNYKITEPLRALSLVDGCVFENYFIEHFFIVHIASSKHSEGWEDS